MEDFCENSFRMPGKRKRWSLAMGACLLAAVLLCISTAPLASEHRLDRLEHRRWTGADAAPSQIGALAQTNDGACARGA